ncbi:MAG: histidine kinase [Chitinophagaceae bacterium]|nr:histidine kinase [Chitinophagaceae bacterium]
MKKPVITLLHIGYWLLYLLLLVLLLLCIKLGSNIVQHPLFLNFRFDVFLGAFAVAPALTGFYIFYSVVFVKTLAKKRILLFFITAVAAAIVGGLAGAFSVMLLFWNGIGAGLFADGFTSAITEFIVMSIIALLNGMVGLVMKGFISWYGDIKLKEELNQKNYETELALVKSQLDPHFLFNTINNIDVLIERDAVKASAYLNKLSHIMRFMLYETKTEKITLQKELEYIGQYIELQKIRSANPNYIDYSVKGSNQQLMITPMLFIPFIENAFKHSESRKLHNAVCIHFDIKGSLILFECENAQGSSTHLEQEYKGLGNELIQKRLMLLYPGKHTLTTNATPVTYNVKLEINCE